MHHRGGAGILWRCAHIAASDLTVSSGGCSASASCRAETVHTLIESHVAHVVGVVDWSMLGGVHSTGWRSLHRTVQIVRWHNEQRRDIAGHPRHDPHSVHWYLLPMLLLMMLLLLLIHRGVYHSGDIPVDGQSWRRTPGHGHSRRLHPEMAQHRRLCSWDEIGCRDIQYRIESSILALRFIVVISEGIRTHVDRRSDSRRSTRSISSRLPIGVGFLLQRTQLRRCFRRNQIVHDCSRSDITAIGSAKRFQLVL